MKTELNILKYFFNENGEGTGVWAVANQLQLLGLVSSLPDQHHPGANGQAEGQDPWGFLRKARETSPREGWNAVGIVCISLLLWYSLHWSWRLGVGGNSKHWEKAGVLHPKTVIEETDGQQKSTLRATAMHHS